MSYQIVPCACGNHDCPLKMYVEWTDAGIVVVVTDDDGDQNNRDEAVKYALENQNPLP